MFISVGALSEDPNFPKIQWPSPEMCSACHTVRDNGDHKWNKEQVLPFLMSYFSSNRILTGTFSKELMSHEFKDLKQTTEMDFFSLPSRVNSLKLKKHETYLYFYIF